MTKNLLIGALAAVTLSVAGCGGGGGSTTPGGSARVSTFITDSMDGNSHVWVTIYHLDLLTASGPVPVYDNPAGNVVDLKSLRDASGARFLLLGKGSIKAGTYTGARFTLSKGLTVFPLGATTGHSKSFEDPNGDGKSEIEVTFPSPKVIGSSDDKVVLDFDLANWTDSAGIISPVVKKVEDSGVDRLDRQEVEDYGGAVTGLTATSFMLAGRAGSQITVTYDLNTSIFMRSGAASPTLANGQSVEVRGTYNPTTQSLAATSIKIEDMPGDHSSHDELVGVLGEVNAAAASFTLGVSRVDGFVPNATTITIATSASTVFRLSKGVNVTWDAFQTFLAAGAIIEVEGVYDPATATLTATKVKIEESDGESHHEHEASINGSISTFDATSGTLNISLKSWQGFSSTAGSIVNVTTNGSTRFRAAKGGGTITKEAFFAGVAVGAKVEAEGNYDGTTLLANSIKLDD